MSRALAVAPIIALPGRIVKRILNENDWIVEDHYYSPKNIE